MANFTLDDIRAAADKKYGSMKIDLGDDGIVELLNPLRLPKEKRDALGKIGERMEAEDADQEAIFGDALRLAAKVQAPCEALIEQIGGDLGVLAQLFEDYSNGTQVGEASASES